MAVRKTEESTDGDPLPIFLDWSGSRLSDCEVLSGSVASLGLDGLYSGHDNHIWNDEGVQSNIRLGFPLPRICAGNWSWNISWV